jgi:hypothetical protein
MTAHKPRDRISQWLVQLLARVGWQKAVVALANKNARILWAVLAGGRRFDANHESVKPQGHAMAGAAQAGSTKQPTRNKTGIDDPRRRALEDASHRSDRQQVNSTNPVSCPWGDDGERMESLLSGWYLGPHRPQRVQQGRL